MTGGEAESGGTEGEGHQGWGRMGATCGGPAFTKSLQRAGHRPASLRGSPYATPNPQQRSQAHNNYYDAILQVRKPRG